MNTTITPNELSTLTAPLAKALEPFTKRFPGSAGERQPVHTVYGGAHLFKSDTSRKLGEKAREGRDKASEAARQSREFLRNQREGLSTAFERGKEAFEQARGPKETA